MLDGAIRTKDLAKKVSDWEHKAVAMTDHGVMYGAVEFYENCLAQGVKPILGCEAYVSPEGINSREGQRYNHLLLLAENETGWHNLIKLNSIANTDGFYYKPRIDHALLAKYNEGIIASSACLAGEIPQFILHDDMEKAISRAEHYKAMMGPGNFFLEIMPNGLEEQKKVNTGILELSKRLDIPVIATVDAHYLNREDYDWHNILLKINTHATVNDDAFGFTRNDFYLMTPQEVYEKLGSECPQALTNTVEIAERCNVKLPLKTGHYILPSLNLEEGETPEDRLRRLAHEGLEGRIRHKGLDEIPEVYKKRLEYELGTITSMGFSAYFLIVSGIIHDAKERNIPIRVGVNSGSLERELVEKYGGVTAEGLVESALDKVHIIEDLGYDNLVISIKSSNVMLCVKAHEVLASQTNYPLHVGITEAGTLYGGNIKSSVGLGIILNEGIGDTIRVSLSGDPVEEIKTAKNILRILDLRKGGIEVVSCPTCGRTKIDLIGLANKVENLVQAYEHLNIKVAVMGCAVNGPGEAKEADLGIAGGVGEGLLIKHGEVVRKIPEDQFIQALKDELDHWEN